MYFNGNAPCSEGSHNLAPPPLLSTRPLSALPLLRHSTFNLDAQAPMLFLRRAFQPLRPASLFQVRHHSGVLSSGPANCLRMAVNGVPSVMRAVRITENGGSEVLKVDSNTPVPQLAEGEVKERDGCGFCVYISLAYSEIALQVLVRNAASGVNFIDTSHRSGLYPLPLPATLGREGAGTVVGTHGDVGDLKADDKGMCLYSGLHLHLSSRPFTF